MKTLNIILKNGNTINYTEDQFDSIDTKGIALIVIKDATIRDIYNMNEIMVASVINEE